MSTNEIISLKRLITPNPFEARNLTSELEDTTTTGGLIESSKMCWVRVELPLDDKDLFFLTSFTSNLHTNLPLLFSTGHLSKTDLGNWYTLVHCNPIFLQPHLAVQPFLQLQKIVLRSFSGAGGSKVLIGSRVLSINFQPQSSGFS
ncbi:hypothetical protein M0804_009740 [Polistes exclamans]|nr:hypothetical protein M0804_009740 [Polistes exclamans]